MRKRIAHFIVSVSIIFACQGAHAGVPTVNIPQIIQDLMAWTTTYAAEVEQVINGIQQIEQHYKMYEQAVKEYEAYQKYYDEVSGYKGFGDIVNSWVFKDVIPDGFADTYNAAAEGNAKGVYKGLKGMAKQYREQTKIWDCENLKESDNALCKTTLEQKSQLREDIENIDKNLADNLKKINDIKADIARTTNAKEIGELTTSLQAATTKLQHDQTRIATSLKLTELAEKRLQQQQREQSIVTLNTASAISWEFPDFKINKDK